MSKNAPHQEDSALRGLKQFRFLDWMLFVIFSAQTCQASFFLVRMSGSRERGGYTLHAVPEVAVALLVTGVLAGAVVGGALAFLGGWQGRLLRGALIGGIVAITVPWLSLMSLYYR